MSPAHNPACAGTVRRRPNLLFIMSDQQRADTLAPHGPCLTPNLDALAAQGARFSRCYAANPICSPSRASLLTGLLPHAHGMVDCTHTVEPYRASLDANAPFWSRSFRAAGYRTGYYGKWHVERTNDLAPFGFDHYQVTSPFVRTESGYARVDHADYAAHRQGLGLPARREPPAEARYVRHEGYRDLLLYGVSDEPVEATKEHYVTSRGIDFLHEAARDPDTPWSLFLSFEAPHEPYLPPRAYRRRYDAASLPRPASFDDDLVDRPAIYRRLRSVWRDLEWMDFAEATACYYGYCSLVDDQVGRLVAALSELGWLDDTLIVFASDHGDLMGAHRLMLKGVPAFEEVYRVPLLMRGPGVPAGLASERTTSLLDVGPTLTRLLLDEPFGGHGRSLAPLLTGEEDAWQDEAFAEMHGQRFAYTQRILWRGRYKYVFNAFDDDELYDLQADPHEMHNLAREASSESLAKEMAGRMWSIVRATNDHTLVNAQDGTYRFLPVGPECGID